MITSIRQLICFGPGVTPQTLRPLVNTVNDTYYYVDQRGMCGWCVVVVFLLCVVDDVRPWLLWLRNYTVELHHIANSVWRTIYKYTQRLQLSP